MSKAERGKNMADYTKYCKTCFYYLGLSDNPKAGPVGLPLCACTDEGGYDSGSGCRYVADLKKCPIDKWPREVFA